MTFCGNSSCLITDNLAPTSGDFFINDANINSVTVTLEAGVTDRAKIGDWTIVHHILRKADSSNMGYYSWVFTVSDPCASSLLTLTVTTHDSMTEITATDTDMSLFKSASYKFNAPSYFDTSVTYDLLTNPSSVRPCFDLSTYTINEYPTGINMGSSSGMI